MPDIAPADAFTPPAIQPARGIQNIQPVAPNMMPVILFGDSGIEGDAPDVRQIQIAKPEARKWIESIGASKQEADKVADIRVAPRGIEQPTLANDGTTLLINRDMFEQSFSPDTATTEVASADAAMIGQDGRRPRGSLRVQGVDVPSIEGETYRVSSTRLAPNRQVSIDTFRPEQAASALLAKVREYDRPAEFYGIYRGTNRFVENGDTEFMDEFVMPRQALAVSYGKWSDLLEGVYPLEGTTESEIFLKQDGELGIRVFEVKPNGQRGNSTLIPRSEISVPQGAQFADFMTASARESLFGNSTRSYSDTELIEAIQSSRVVEKDTLIPGNLIGMGKVKGLVVPYSGDVDMFGSGSRKTARGSVFVSNNFITETLDNGENRFDYGHGYGSAHVHLSSNSEEERVLRDAVGYDHYTIPSPTDVVLVMQDEDRMSRIGMTDTGVRMMSVVALEPNRKAIMGQTYLDLIDLVQDEDSLRPFLEQAVVADKSGSLEDHIRYFNLARNFVTDKAPDYLRTPDRALLASSNIDDLP